MATTIGTPRMAEAQTAYCGACQTRTPHVRGEKGNGYSTLICVLCEPSTLDAPGGAYPFEWFSHAEVRRMTRLRGAEE